MSSLMEPGPDQADNTTQRSLSPPVKSRQHLISSLLPLSIPWALNSPGSLDNEGIREEVDRLHKSVKMAEKHIRVAQKAQLLAEEQSRRRAELLEEARQDLEAAQTENRILVTTIGQLQSGMPTFTDVEAKQEMYILYHDLENWSLGHFGNKSTFKSPKNDIPELGVILSEIAGMIFRTFWNGFIVGCQPPLGNYLRRIDEKIKEQLANHISGHWRFATSTAIMVLESSNLTDQCHRVTEQAERCFGHYALTDRPKRMDQLYDIVLRCVKLKHKLDCQEDTYLFWCSHPDMRFQNDRMRDIEAQTTSDGFVEVSLWPCLFKRSADGEWAVVEKEVVKKMAQNPAMNDSMREDMLEQKSENLLEL